jgi:hypothetical protein
MQMSTLLKKGIMFDHDGMFHIPQSYSLLSVKPLIQAEPVNEYCHVLSDITHNVKVGIVIS